MSKYLDITGLSYLWDKIRAKFAPKTEGIPFIISTTTTAGVWKGNASFSALQNGQSIKYWTSHTGVSGQQTTLELTLADGETTTGAIPVFYRGTTVLTNHVGANNCCMLTYRENVTIGDETIARGWWLDFAYYKDTTTDTYDRTLVTNFKPTATGKIIYARQLVFQMSDGTYKSITNSNSTNTAHTPCTDKANGLGIINPQAVHFYNNATNVAVGKACGAYMYSAISSLDFRYSSNCGSTLTAKKPVYLVFTYEDGKFYLDDENEWYSQDIPRTASEEEGKYVYMFIGYAYSAYQSSLAIEKPLHVYKDGKIQPFMGDISDGQDGKSAFQIALEQGFGDDIFHATTSDATQITGWTPPSSAYDFKSIQNITSSDVQTEGYTQTTLTQKYIIIRSDDNTCALVLTRSSNDGNWQFSGYDLTLNGNAYNSYVVTGLTAGATDLEILRKAGIDDVTPKEEGAWLESLRGKSAYETAVEYGTYRGSYVSIKSDTLDSWQGASYWEDYITNNSGGFNTFELTTGTANVGDAVVMRYGGTISSTIYCVVGGIKSITTNWSGANIIIDPDNFAVLADDGTKTDAELWESCNVHGNGTEADWAQKTAYTSEDWQFVLLDGTTVTKKVVIAP